MSREPGPSGFGFHSTAEQVTAGRDLSGKTYLVTGVNSGLGAETARVLALRGAHVLGAARTADKAAEALRDLDATPIACELSDLPSVGGAVEAVRRTGRSLDGIIANAGIMAIPELRRAHGLELQFFVNHVGHFALVTPLVDQLTDDGRVVILSSGAHRMAPDVGIEFDNLDGARDYHPWRMYGQSKLANILFARQLAGRLAAGQTANAVHPGVILTNLLRYTPNADEVKERLRPMQKSIPEGAATQCYVATHPDAATTTGAYWADCNVAEATPISYDDALAERLWHRTEQILATA